MNRAPPASESPDFDLEMRLLLEAIAAKYQYDFRAYAEASLRRRLRVAAGQMGVQSLSQLQDQVMRRPEVFSRLLSFLTVQVSDLFRDPSYYRALRSEVVPHLQTYPSLKVWVAGCSTGEEVYSLAILLAEEGLLSRTLIYATDINPDALQAAERGVYGLDRLPDFTRNYQAAGGKASLADYYTAGYGNAAFSRALRAQVVFADHSLATDAVFSEVHLVSCRNVLIYFNSGLQDRAVGLFHEALVRNGFLGLGSRETLRFTTHRERFSELAPEARIYQRRG